MKRAFSRDFLRNKWVVPVAALTLTFAIGSVSFAATGNNAGELPTASSSSSTTTVVSNVTATSGGVPTTVITTPPAPILLSPALANTTPADRETQSPEDLAMQKAKEDAILSLIRDRMTEADKVAFDYLRSLATEQQLALAKAQADLSDTAAKIRALVFKYLGIATTTSSSPAPTIPTTTTISTTSTSVITPLD